MSRSGAIPGPVTGPLLAPGLAARVMRPEVCATLVPAGLAWAAIGLLPASGLDLDICASPPASTAALRTAWALELARLRPGAQLAEWSLMVLAMMLPTLAPNLGYVRGRVFSADRRRAGAAFLAGYGLVWMLCGVLAAFAVPALRAIVQSAPAGLDAPATFLAAAAAWLVSPWRRRALARCHYRPVLAPGDAVSASAAFGAAHGMRCAATCLPLMIALQAAGGGALGMVLLTAVILSERAAHRPQPATAAAVLVLFGIVLSMR